MTGPSGRADAAAPLEAAVGIEPSGGAAPADLPPGTATAERLGRDGGRELGAGSPSERRAGAADWLLVVGLCLLAAWVAVMAVFFLPLHLGPVPVPVSALLPVALLVWAPRVADRLTGRIIAAALVVLTWFAVTVYLVLVRNDLYLNYPITVHLGQWRVMLLLGLGALTAAATLGLLWGDHLRRKLTSRPGRTGDADGEPAGVGSPAGPPGPSA